ncbi:MAG: GDSL-type esterase/lipase family protein [Bacteroidia bacterium]
MKRSTKVGIPFMMLFLCCQKTPAQPPLPPTVNLSHNKILLPQDNENFYRLVDKMRCIQQGERRHVVILHFGGSHVQGGSWGEGLMNTLQESLGTRGGGYWAFPFAQVRTNGPFFFRIYSDGTWKAQRCTRNSEVSYPLGLSGMIAITEHSCHLSIKNQWPKLDGFTRVKVFYLKNTAYTVVPLFPIQDITEGNTYTEYVLAEKSDSLSFWIQKNVPWEENFVLDGISCENDSAGVYYAPLGINGATSDCFLRCANLPSHLRELNADLCIFSLGVNDVRDPYFSASAYAQKYDSLFRLVWAAHPHAAILLTTISDNYLKRRIPNPRTLLGNQTLHRLTQKYPLALWDLHALMGGQTSITYWGVHGVAEKDKIHFTRKGYLLLGSLLAQAILEHVPQ